LAQVQNAFERMKRKRRMTASWAGSSARICICWLPRQGGLWMRLRRRAWSCAACISERDGHGHVQGRCREFGAGMRETRELRDWVGRGALPWE
jgi:hypothetical protein